MYITCVCDIYTKAHACQHVTCSLVAHPGGHRWHERVLAGAGSVADGRPLGGQTRGAGGLSSAQWLEGPDGKQATGIGWFSFVFF